MAISKLMSYALAIFVLVVVTIGTLSLLNLTQKDVADAIKKFETSTGTEEIVGEKPDIPETHRTAIDNLLYTIDTLRQSKRVNCILNYQGLPELGDGGTSFSLTQNDPEQGKTSLRILGGAGGKQLVETKSIGNIDLCVVEDDNGLLVPRDVTSVQITYQGGNILIANPQNVPVAADFNDGGWLYKDTRGKICFFPSSDYGFDENVLNDGTNEDYISYQANRVSARTQIQGIMPPFQLCKPQSNGEFFTYKSIELAGEYKGLSSPSKEIILQHCEGSIGVDCPAIASSCTSDFTQLTTQGCTVLASEHDTFSLDGCLGFGATSGTIIPAFETTISDVELSGKSFQEEIDFAFPDNEDEFVKLFTETEWFGFKDEALLCQDQQWIACNDYAEGKSIKGYSCVKTQNTYMWQKST